MPPCGGIVSDALKKQIFELEARIYFVFVSCDADFIISLWFIILFVVGSFFYMWIVDKKGQFKRCNVVWRTWVMF